jgi:hypothetical protein
MGFWRPVGWGASLTVAYQVRWMLQYQRPQGVLRQCTLRSSVKVRKNCKGTWSEVTIRNREFDYSQSKEGAMATKLDKQLKREIDVDGKPYMLAITPEGLKLTEKGKRKGQELSWKNLLAGQAAQATVLNASAETETEESADAAE